ncbi:reverse transcriptase domain-containing protein [Tanacetum coccineum]
MELTLRINPQGVRLYEVSFYTLSGNHVKEILLKLNLLDHRILKDGGEGTTMTTVNQGISVEEIKQVVAQRVANAIEAIAIYETKTNMARKSMSQTKRQEYKCGNCKKVGHITRNCKTPTAARNQRTRTCYECGSLRHYKSECPIVKFQNHVDMIHGRVMASKPKIMQDAITKLIGKKISTLAERQAENKRKLDNNNQAQQQPPKKQGMAIADTAGLGEKKEYAGTLPLCNKCKFHHNGQCTIKCTNYKRVGHLTRDCRSLATTNNQRNLTCYECGNQGQYRSDCPERKKQNHENQTRGTGAHGVVHALGGGETDQDPNNIEDEIKA